MYSTAKANEIIISDNDNKYLDAGIHDNVKLESSKIDESPKSGQTFLEIRFEKDGKLLIHTEWEARKLPTETDEQYNEKCSKQVKRMLQILECFYSKETLVFSGNSFKEFAAWVATMLNSADKTKLLKVKIVYNDKGYTTLPRYAKYQFIEPMILPEGTKTKISKLNIDLFQRPIIADVEAPEINPFSTNNTPTIDTNVDIDLPF